MAGPETDLWENADRPDKPDESEAFLVDIEGFDGPLDLLLALPRVQKVDLPQRSILALAAQYVASLHDPR